MKKLIILLLIFLFNPIKSYAVNNAETGIRIMNERNKTYIIDVIPNSPAARANILPTTKIYKINNENIRKYSAIETINMLFGEPDTEVKLLIEVKNHKQEITLKRELLKYNNTIPKNECMSKWIQIAPPYFAKNELLINDEDYPRRIKKYIYANNYWVNRRKNFEETYNFLKQYDTQKNLINYIKKQSENREGPKGQQCFLLMNDQIIYANNLAKRK